MAWLVAFRSTLWLMKGTSARPSVLLMAFSSVALLGTMALNPLQRLKTPIYQEESPYQQVRIREDDLFRYLVLDRTFHATMWKADPMYLFTVK